MVQNHPESQQEAEPGERRKVSIASDTPILTRAGCGCENGSLKAVLKIVLSFLLLYAGDYLSVRFNRAPLGAFDVDVYYAVGLKNHKVEYMQGDTESQTCVHSMLPHMGYPPCWYVSRHRQKWIDIGSLSRPFYRAQVSERPPSMAYVAPVIQDARSEARNAISSAISSGCATRPSGCVVLLCSRNFA